MQKMSRLIAIWLVAIMIVGGLSGAIIKVQAERPDGVHSSIWDTGSVDDILEFMAEHYNNAGTPDNTKDDYWDFSDPDDVEVAEDVWNVTTYIKDLREAAPSSVVEWFGSINQYSGLSWEIAKMAKTETIGICEVAKDPTFQGNILAGLGETKVLDMTSANTVVGDVLGKAQNSIDSVGGSIHSTPYTGQISLSDIGKYESELQAIGVAMDAADIGVLIGSAYAVSSLSWENIKGNKYYDIVSKVVTYEVGDEIGTTNASFYSFITGSVEGVRLCFSVAGLILGAIAGSVLAKSLAGLCAMGGTALLGPGIGTVVGAAAGAIVGNFIGTRGAKMISQKIYDALADIDAIPQNTWDKFHRFWRNHHVHIEIEEITSIGDDNYVPDVDIIMVKIKNTGDAEGAFIVSPLWSNWTVISGKKSTNTTPSLYDLCDMANPVYGLVENTVNVHLNPGEEATVLFWGTPWHASQSWLPISKSGNTEIGFSVWYAESWFSMTPFGWHIGQYLVMTQSEPFVTNKEPVLLINAKSDRNIYAPGDSATISIDVENAGVVRTDEFTVGVTVRNKVYGNTIDASQIVPLTGRLEPKEKEEYTATINIPSTAPRGMYEIAVDCWWDPYNSNHYYLDDLEWRDIFYVGDPAISIDSPTETKKMTVGSYSHPISTFTALINVTDSTTGEPIYGLSSQNFAVHIGSKDAPFISTYNDHTEQYRLLIKPPAQSSGGNYDLKIDLLLNDEVYSSDVEQNSINYSSVEETNVDAVLVIDRSASMSGNPIYQAKESSKLFVDNMKAGDAIGVISFSSAGATKIDYPLTKIISNSEKNSAKAAIDNISSDANTALGEGLHYAYDQLTQNASTNSKAIILLSDGRNNSGENPYSVIPYLQNSSIPAYTIGLGTSVDEKTMSDIASMTGGEYYCSPNSGQLQELYNKIAGVITGKSAILSTKGVINQNQTKNESVTIDSNTASAVFSSGIGGSEIDFLLIDPYGRVINESVASNDSNISFTEAGTYKAYTVNNPLEGIWTLQIVGKNVSNNEPYWLSVDADTNLTLTADTIKNQYYAGEPVKINAAVMNPKGVLTNLSVLAKITNPYGISTTIHLYDDGFHSDGNNNDGFFSNYFFGTNSGGSGSYRVKISTYGIDDMGTQFLRESQISFYVDDAPYTSPLTTNTVVHMVARQGERTEAVIAFNSTENIFGSITATDLVGNNMSISASNILLSKGLFHINSNSTETVGISLDVPAYLPSGIYNGSIVLSSDKANLRVPVFLEVKSFSVNVSDSYIVIENLTEGETFEQAIYLNLTGYGGLNNLSAIVVGNAIKNWTSPNLTLTDIPEEGSGELLLKIQVPEGVNGTYYETVYLSSDRMVIKPIAVRATVARSSSTEMPEPSPLITEGQSYTTIIASIILIMSLLILLILILLRKRNEDFVYQLPIDEDEEYAIFASNTDISDNSDVGVAPESRGGIGDLPISKKIKFLLPGGGKMAFISKGERINIGRIELYKYLPKDMKDEVFNISREHCELWNDNGQWYIEDKGSTNGTKLNGEEIKGEGPISLKDGDEVVLGNVLKIEIKI